MKVLGVFFLLCHSLLHADAANIRRRQQTKVYDPNTRCDLCGSIDGEKPRSDHVPEERINELVDTVIAGMMPCGALEHAGIERVFTEDVCSAMKKNVGAVCCSSLPSSSSTATTSSTTTEKEEEEKESSQEEAAADQPNDIPASSSEASKAEDEDCGDRPDEATDANIHDMPNPKVERSSIAEFCQRNGQNDEQAQIICENTMQRWESSSTKNADHTNSYISWFKSVGKEVSSY